MRRLRLRSLFVLLLLLISVTLVSCSRDLVDPENGDLLTYVVSFKTNTTQELDSIEVEENTKLFEPKLDSDAKTIEGLSLDGYTFLGWFYDVNKKWEFDEDLVTKDLVLEGKWKVKEFSITFNTNGGKDINTKKYKYTQSLYDIKEPTRPNFYFQGWYLDETLLEEFKLESMPAKNLELYAKWTKVHEVIFVTNGGTSIAPVNVRDEETLTAVETSYEGHVLEGWYTDEGLTTGFSIDTPITQNITLYAKWTQMENLEVVYTETFESLQNIKDGGGNSSEYQDYTYISDDTNLEWELINARIDLGMKEGENALTIGGFGNTINDIGMGRIHAYEIHGGLSMLSFEARLPFSPKSTYPQVPGKDKAAHVKISVYINDKLEKVFQFASDETANKGETFIIDNLNVQDTYSLSIVISSGHRLTVDNIIRKTNTYSKEDKNFLINFEQTSFDYDNDETIRNINGRDFAVKEIHTAIMHGEKEIPYMDLSINGSSIARFRGDKDDYLSTPISYIYNTSPFDSVNTITFDARLFGSDVYFNYDSIINIYYKNSDNSTWTKISSNFELTENFTNYKVNLNIENAYVKIEVLKGKVNIDNINFIY